MNSVMLWGSELDEEDLPHFIAEQDAPVDEAFWRDFPGCARYVVKPYPNNPSVSYISVWLTDTTSDEVWFQSASALPEPPLARKHGLNWFGPNLVVVGDGLPPPIDLWRAHPSVKKVRLYFRQGVEALAGLWHIAGGGEGWVCEIWRAPRR